MFNERREKVTLALRKSWEWQASSSLRSPVVTYPARSPVSRAQQRRTHSGGVVRDCVCVCVCWEGVGGWGRGEELQTRPENAD